MKPLITTRGLVVCEARSCSNHLANVLCCNRTSKWGPLSRENLLRRRRT